MGEFRVKITIGDFVTSTVEKAENKDQAIKKFANYFNFRHEPGQEIKITCEEIQADPVVLSAEEMYNKLMCGKVRHFDRIIGYGETMHQNGRLERDLEVKGLVDAVKSHKNYYAGCISRDILAEIKKLKPLNHLEMKSGK